MKYTLLIDKACEDYGAMMTRRLDSDVNTVILV